MSLIIIEDDSYRKGFTMLNNAYLILEKNTENDLKRSYKLEFPFSLSALASVFVLTKSIDKVYVSTLSDEIIGTTLLHSDGYVDVLNDKHIEGGIDNFLINYLLPYQEDPSLCIKPTLTKVICGTGDINGQLMGIEKLNEVFDINLSDVFDYDLKA